MNLVKLFEAQRKLDEHIIREKGLEGQDLLHKKILALQVELGELANEYRGFKFWSNHQEPRTNVEIKCPDCDGYGVTNFDAVFEGFAEMECKRCNKTGILGYANPLLEEYVDCLHFILSIGNDINMNEVYEDEEPKPLYCEDIIEQFIVVNDWVNSLYYRRHEYVNGEMYDLVFAYFLGLGEMLSFTWEQVEEAYFQKNAVNHERQNHGY